MQSLPTIEAGDWRTITPLMLHQREAIAKLLPSRVGALFMEMGTGKTRTTIELVSLRRHKISRVIWFCPVTLKATIKREIMKHTDCPESSVYLFDDRTREDNLPLDKGWFIVGIESMSSSPRAIFCVQQLIDERAFVVVDESTYIKGHSAKRTKRITILSEPARYRLVLTGTPITQGVVDLFAQMRFLSPRILGYKSFYTFAAKHLVYHPRHLREILYSRNVEWLAERMKPYVYQVTKAECLTLPKEFRKAYHCSLSFEQMEAYEQAKEDFVDDLLKYEDEDSEMTNGIAVFRLFSRLAAIACGLYDGEPIKHGRLTLLESVLRDVQDTHIVVWAKYLGNLEEIEHHLSEAGRPVIRVDGNVSERKREKRLRQWGADGGVLAISQGVGSHGLDLTPAATAIFYSSGFKYSERHQAESRCHRNGQTRPVTYISLWAECGIEQRIALALANKANALKEFRAEIEQVKITGKEKLREFVMGL